MAEDSPAKLPVPEAASEPVGEKATGAASSNIPAPTTELNNPVEIVALPTSAVDDDGFTLVQRPRGRPPGAKNKPKPPPPPPPPPPKRVRAPRPKKVEGVPPPPPSPTEPVIPAAPTPTHVMPTLPIPRCHSQVLHEWYATEKQSLRDH